MEENDFVSIWLEENGNPAIEEITVANQAAANRMTKYLLDKSLSSNELSDMLDINHNEIASWLKGTHAFSLNKLKEMSYIIEN